MRRGLTAAVVVVVAAIAVAAGFDALRGESAPEPATEARPEPPTASTTSDPEEPPSAEEPGGTLYYTDEKCALQAVELPGSTAAEAPGWDECRFVLSPTARRVAGKGSGWDPRSDPNIGRLYESQGGLIQVSTNQGPQGSPFSGEAPAWRPDGALTYFAQGAVRAWPDGGVVMSQGHLLRALEQTTVPGLAGFDRVRVREAAWLDQTRLAAILSVDGPSGSWDVLTTFEDGNIEEAYVDPPGSFADLRASPTGKYIAARRGTDGFILAEPGRGAIGPGPGIVGYRAIAWSPDEQWAAVAAEGGVFVFRPGAVGPPELELALDAHDLDWRGEPGAPALAGTAAVREWLGRTSAIGRLFLTQRTPFECRLRALQIPNLDWAPEPPGLPSPCQFTPDVVIPEGQAPRPGGGLIASCRDDRITVTDDVDHVIAVFRGCAPAWSPDGRLTFIRDGGLFEGGFGEQKRRLMSRDEVSELLGRPSALEEITWADQRALLGRGSLGPERDRRADDDRSPDLCPLVHDAGDRRATRECERHGRGPHRSGGRLPRQRRPPRAHRSERAGRCLGAR